MPQPGARGGVGAEARGCAQGQALHEVEADALPLAKLIRAVGVVFDEKGGVVPDGEVEDDLGGPLEGLAHLEGQCIHQLEGGGPRLDEGGQGGVGGLQVVEDEQSGRHVGEHRDGPEDALGDESEVPSLPTKRWARMSAGWSKSSRELTP